MQTQAIPHIDATSAHAVLAAQGKTFYWARFFLPRQMANAATRLYHFCRYVDDVADTSDQPAQATLALDSMLAEMRTGQSQHPIVGDAMALFQQYAIPIAIPEALIEGVQADLTMTQLADEDALLRYCYRVAGTVGLMMAKLLGVSDQHAYYHAIDLGIAMQLTNICRDVAEDAAMQRIYLPQNLLTGASHPQTLATIARHDPQVLSAIRVLLQRADAYYASGYRGLAYLPWRARFAMLIAARLYQQIGKRILRNPAQSLQQRTVVGPLEKIGVILRQVCVGQWQHKLWHAPRQHCHTQALHQALSALPLTHAPQA